MVFAAPLLLFPTLRPALTVGALVALLLTWLLGWIGAGRPGTPTALDVPLLLLALMVPIAVWASAFPELTLPKLAGLTLGLAAFRAIVNAVRAPRHLRVAVALFLALGLGLGLVGLVTTSWIGKWAALESILIRIPRLVIGLPGAESGIHPNALAGTLLLLWPLAFAAASSRGSGGSRGARAMGLGTLLLTLFFGVVLVLTQSRSGWIGAGAGLAVMAWIRWRPPRWLVIAGAVVLALGLLYVGPSEALRAAFPAIESGSVGTIASTATLEGRLELWNRALYAIQDFPFTGTGLGTFSKVVHLLYPLTLVGPDVDIGHVHNTLLQVALDLGLPGLVAYLALVGVALWIGWRVAWAPALALARVGEGTSVRETSFRWLGTGIVGSLVAFHVYGLTDAVPLGSDRGLALWMLLALAAALWRVAPVQEQRPFGVPEPSSAREAA